MTIQEEKHLISRLKTGDKEAFKQLFECYYPLFLGFARRMLRDNYVADDIIQNVFMRIWSMRERLDEERGLRNYLLVAVRNEIYYHLRSELRKRHEEIDSDYAYTAINPDHEIDAREMNRSISSIIASMPERRREIFNMSRHQRLSNAEIAERLGISIRTVEKHIENALSDIRKSLPVSIIALILSI